MPEFVAHFINEIINFIAIRLCVIDDVKHRFHAVDGKSGIIVPGRLAAVPVVVRADDRQRESIDVAIVVAVIILIVDLVIKSVQNFFGEHLKPVGIGFIDRAGILRGVGEDIAVKLQLAVRGIFHKGVHGANHIAEQDVRDVVRSQRILRKVFVREIDEKDRHADISRGRGAVLGECGADTRNICRVISGTGRNKYAGNEKRSGKGKKQAG